MSACDRLLTANMLVSWSRLNDGGGSLPSTLVDMDTSPSSLPSSTAYDGPPACKNREPSLPKPVAVVLYYTTTLYFAGNPQKFGRFCLGRKGAIRARGAC